MLSQIHTHRVISLRYGASNVSVESAGVSSQINHRGSSTLMLLSAAVRRLQETCFSDPQRFSCQDVAWTSGSKK